MKEMSTVTEVLDYLKTQGYTIDFNLKENSLVYPDSAVPLFPDEFVVDRHFRFEGMSDPDDEAIVYAISSEKYKLKGVLVNAYGIYSDPVSDQMMQALRQR